MDLDAASIANALYDDLEMEAFFESSDEEAERAPTKKKVAAADPVDRALTEEEIERDLDKIEQALEQQPYRRDDSLRLRSEAENHPEWKRFQKGDFRSVVVSNEAEVDMLQPAVLTRLLDGWPAKTKWTKQGLLEHYPNLTVVATRLISAGGLGKSNPVLIKLQSYLRYCETTTADFPLYVFDHNLPSSEMRHDYSPPPMKMFLNDLFDPESYPADFPRDSFGFFSKTEWIIIGPRISGSPLHKDPLYTSAWNSLLLGTKHWAVFPPHVALEKLRKRPDWEPPILWFLEELPKLRGENLGLIEITQRAGDTVFLPEGWWHAVLNLDEINVAVTHNAVIDKEHIWSRLEQTHAPFVEAYLSIKPRTS